MSTMNPAGRASRTISPPPQQQQRQQPPQGRHRLQGHHSLTTMTPAATSAATSAAGRPRTASSSDFCVSLMPRDKIVRRTLHSWSVHHSLTTNKWVATISRPENSSSSSISVDGSVNPNFKLRHMQFIFDSEREGRKFCLSYAPPKMSASPSCQLCHKQLVPPSSSSARRCHCRNCGVVICENASTCCTRWGSRMVPKTYMSPFISASIATVRVCKSCDWLSNAFCMALIQGRYQDALMLHQTGNINLRTCFKDINKEAMFPIHCAVMGGSLELVKWLVDDQLVPIMGAVGGGSGLGSAGVKPQPLQSVQTSASRTLLDLAMTGRPKVEILMYFIGQKGLRMQDVKDPKLAPKTLETLMKSGFVPNNGIIGNPHATTGAAGGGGVHVVMDQHPHRENSNAEESTVMTIEDACNICFERQMDCVLIPCGHQVCCTECGEQVRACPICKVDCTVLRIFRAS